MDALLRLAESLERASESFSDTRVVLCVNSTGLGEAGIGPMPGIQPGWRTFPESINFDDGVGYRPMLPRIEIEGQTGWLSALQKGVPSDPAFSPPFPREVVDDKVAIYPNSTWPKPWGWFNADDPEIETFMFWRIGGEAGWARFIELAEQAFRICASHIDRLPIACAERVHTLNKLLETRYPYCFWLLLCYEFAWQRWLGGHVRAPKITWVGSVQLSWDNRAADARAFMAVMRPHGSSVASAHPLIEHPENIRHFRSILNTNVFAVSAAMVRMISSFPDGTKVLSQAATDPTAKDPQGTFELPAARSSPAYEDGSGSSNRGRSSAANAYGSTGIPLDEESAIGNPLEVQPDSRPGHSYTIRANASSPLIGKRPMFNLLVSANSTAWESDQRMRMPASRFGEMSGDEIDGISVDNADSMKRLEHIPTLLMYETGVDGPSTKDVRYGQMRDVRVRGGDVTFRFTEVGRIPRETVSKYNHRLQMSEFEDRRTHWAVKDGEIPQDLLRHLVETPRTYDVVLSFAGENRDYVQQVAELLGEAGVEVFYDLYEQETLWGKDLAEHLTSVYRKQARFCVMFISEHYAAKLWTSLERRAAMARAMTERTEYILPVRFDDTEIPGLNPTVGYIDLRSRTPSQLSEAIRRKLGRI